MIDKVQVVRPRVGAVQKFSRALIELHLLFFCPSKQMFCFDSTMKHLLLWANFRRFYLYVMTENMKRVLMAHQQVVLHEDVKSRFQLCERTIMSAANLPEFDEAYTR